MPKNLWHRCTCLVAWASLSLLLSACLTSKNVTPPLSGEPPPQPVDDASAPDDRSQVDDWPLGTSQVWSLDHAQQVPALLGLKQRSASTGCYSLSQWGHHQQGWVPTPPTWPAANPRVHVWIAPSAHRGTTAIPRWLMNAQPCLSFESGGLKWDWRDTEGIRLPSVPWSTWFDAQLLEGQRFSDTSFLWGINGHWPIGSQVLTVQVTPQDDTYVMHARAPYFRSLQEFLESPRTCWQQMCWKFTQWQEVPGHPNEQQGRIEFEWTDAMGLVLKTGLGVAVMQHDWEHTWLRAEEVPTWVQSQSSAWQTVTGLKPAWTDLNGEFWSGYHWPAGQTAAPLGLLFNAAAAHGLTQALAWAPLPHLEPQP